MRALRTIPVMIDIARDMEAHCPDVVFPNYTVALFMKVLAGTRVELAVTDAMMPRLDGLGNCVILPNPFGLIALLMAVAETLSRGSAQDLM